MPVRCYLCPGRGESKFMNKGALRRHQDLKHGDRQTYKRKLISKASSGRHTKAKLSHCYCCGTCGKVLRSQQALDQHTEAKHPQCYCCDTCGNKLPSQQALAQHHTDKHPFFECPYCECKFTTGQALDQHKEYQHGEYQHTLRYHCDNGTILYSHKALDQHHIDHHPPFEGQHDESQPWYCQTCEKDFISKAAFDHHTGANHHPRYCYDTRGTALDLQAPLNQHHTDKHIPLEWMLPAQVPSLASDTRGAKYPPRFECQYCDIKFSTDDARRGHEDAEHHRVFQWEYGDPKFVSDDARLQHENAKDKFMCRYCDTSFILLESRQYHEEMKHILAFQCSRCRLNFHTTHERDAHEKSDHSYSTVVSSLSAAQPHSVSSYSSSLLFPPRSILSTPDHISDMKRSQIASPATSQCSHAEVDELSHDPAKSQTSDEALTSDEETSSLDEGDISHSSGDSPSIARPQDLICHSAIHEQLCNSVCQRSPASSFSSSVGDDNKSGDGQDDARNSPAEDFQAARLCVSCSQVFDTDEDLRGHLCAFRGTIFQPAPHCSFCYIQFNDESSLLKHLEEDRITFRCCLCQTLCCSNDILQDHLSDHLTCRRCGEIFMDDLALCNHVGLEHPVVVCWDCDGAVIEQDSLELHYAVFPKHPSCPFCRVGKRTPDDMEEHIKNHHATELYDSTPNEIEVSQSNGEAAMDGNSNVSVTS
ncbi:hypothetical protein PAXRUDRAFT_290624 [Paxillus rubicundulus Ve08.2h10]|uniref:C2H2-type domain-containing protein n=1 Tax=Paxillus rubicundulus Ve08.2h10 TaxID=930991 RepID=A0A0D0DLH0_9AGAM|nr:hypothetical protein PAXRUDRAFT_290624 [Paxillus rubicundulus Ve08.2h10]